MSIEITDTGGSVLITGLGLEGDKEVSFNKDDISQTLDGDRVAVTDGRASYAILYADVDVPVGLTSAEDLRDFINGLIPSAGGGSSTVVSLTTSTSGTIASGAITISVLNDGVGAGSWNSDSLPSQVAKTHPPTGGLYDAIPYDATGTVFIIDVTR